jgi:hypothetical protein
MVAVTEMRPATGVMDAGVRETLGRGGCNVPVAETVRDGVSVVAAVPEGLPLRVSVGGTVALGVTAAETVAGGETVAVIEPVCDEVAAPLEPEGSTVDDTDGAAAVNVGVSLPDALPVTAELGVDEVGGDASTEDDADAVIAADASWLPLPLLLPVVVLV